MTFASVSALRASGDHAQRRLDEACRNISASIPGDVVFDVETARIFIVCEHPSGESLDALVIPSGQFFLGAVRKGRRSLRPLLRPRLARAASAVRRSGRSGLFLEYVRAAEAAIKSR